jgi:hypothetical protein
MVLERVLDEGSALVLCKRVEWEVRVGWREGEEGLDLGEGEVGEEGGVS